MAETMLLSGIVGSTAYGLAGPDSDIDRLGVYAAPTIAFHGLRPPTGKSASTVRTGPDIALHEAAKFATLCLAGNPTVTELLWLPDNLYETRTPLGDQLIDIRGAFLSARRCRDAYFGYATQQMRRLLDTGQFQSKMRARVAEHGRHLLRLLDQGYDLYATGRLTIRVAHPQRYLDFGERVAADPEVARSALVEAESRFDTLARCALPTEPDERAVEDWLHAVRAAHYGQAPDARHH
jgi:hypothetical protein